MKYPITKILYILTSILLILAPIDLNAETSKSSYDTIILVHGLGRTSTSMVLLKRRLEKAGYQVISESYPSTKRTIQEHAKWLQTIINQCEKDQPNNIHLVTHSLGGIITRYLFATKKPDSLGRVVMLSPPNAGSEVIDFLKDSELFKGLLGPSSQQIGTDKDSIPQNLGPVDFELGVITGDVSFNPINSLLIPGEDDGKVSLESAKVKGMKDFLVVHKSHTFIMNSPEIANQIIHFLQNGIFIHPTPPQS